jgi:hypothetical protein
LNFFSGYHFLIKKKNKLKESQSHTLSASEAVNAQGQADFLIYLMAFLAPRGRM